MKPAGMRQASTPPDLFERLFGSLGPKTEGLAPKL